MQLRGLIWLKCFKTQGQLSNSTRPDDQMDWVYEMPLNLQPSKFDVRL
jgi:hypothetical protein